MPLSGFWFQPEFGNWKCDFDILYSLSNNLILLHHFCLTVLFETYPKKNDFPGGSLNATFLSQEFTKQNI